MAQLEQRLRESELQVHGALLGRGTSYGDMLMLRLQVSENKQLKFHLRLLQKYSKSTKKNDVGL